ncbi:MAG: cytochrome c [Caldimicrobium sp.]|nr:cytochrome c [Caldimicrobium sp.]MCX7874214.1 cytochrome c [Caldimicrobium sp.]MDW8094618.1 cytochrome c [Caldimicrobium sp.]
MIALLQCSACHALGDSGLRPLSALVKKLGLKEQTSAEAFIDAIGAYPYMPPFVGTPEEKKALGLYLTTLAK